MLLLSKEDIQLCFTMNEAIETTKEALATYSNGEADVPLRTNIDIPSQNGQSLYMPAYVSGQQPSLGIKIVSVYPDNVNKNLPSVPATMVVLDPETGVLTGIVDGTYLTQLRTGAVQGAATDLLSRKDARIGALIGTGGQAECQLRAMLAVRNLTEVRVSANHYGNAAAFAKAMNPRFNAEIIAVESSQECIEYADIITTVTTSKEPTFSAEWVKPGAHINGMGAYTPAMREIPPEIIKKADCIIFDTMDGVLAEAGDFISPLKDNLFKADHYDGELGQLINRTVSGRKKDDDITIFKSVGSAVLDVTVAGQIVNQAKDKNLGKSIPL